MLWVIQDMFGVPWCHGPVNTGVPCPGLMLLTLRENWKSLSLLVPDDAESTGDPIWGFLWIGIIGYNLIRIIFFFRAVFLTAYSRLFSSAFRGF